MLFVDDFDTTSCPIASGGWTSSAITKQLGYGVGSKWSCTLVIAPFANHTLIYRVVV